VQTVRRPVSSATDIADEHFNQLALFARSSSKLMLAVQALNDAVAAGTSSYVLCGGPFTF
jgi:hypothetical protein